MDIFALKKAYFIGIGGIGMSALARLLQHRSIQIVGSDQFHSELIDELEREGISIQQGENPEKFLACDVDLVVYSEAIPLNHDELLYAKKLNIPCLSYPEVLGLVSGHYRTIAVCGAHGKSTTTSMLGLAMEACGLDPTVIVGTKVPGWGWKNIRIGGSPWLVIEACEYRRSFMQLKLYAAIVLNIDEEHLDYYRDIDDCRLAFHDFIRLVPQDGLVIGNGEDVNILEIIKDFDTKVALYSSVQESADYFYRNGNVMHWGDSLGMLKLQIPGDHNIMNALSVIGLIHQLNFPLNSCFNALNDFSGTWRRFQHIGILPHNIDVYDDYAHHPTEIQATLKAARLSFPKRRIVCIFQPHQYNRTKKLFSKFMRAFDNADEVIIPNIYEVRDTRQDIESVSVDAFVNTLLHHHKSVKNGDGFAKTLNYLRKSLQPDDVVFTMGAGDVYEISKELVSSRS